MNPVRDISVCFHTPQEHTHKISKFCRGWCTRGSTLLLGENIL